VYYADLTHQKLQDTGYYEDTAPFKISDEVCLWFYAIGFSFMNYGLET
jgi:hypothetical protein